MEVIFDMQVNVKVSTKLVLSFLVEVARHVQCTQNRKLVNCRNCFMFYSEAK